MQAESVIDGERIHPFANASAAAIVFLFINTDCPIANRYAPTIARFYDRYRSQQVAFWLVYADPAEDRVRIQEHLREYELKPPALRDPEHNLVAYCRATKTPQAVVFKSNGEVVYRGRIDDMFTDFGKRRAQATQHDLQDTLDTLLRGERIAFRETPVIGCDIPGTVP
ncbi:MAG: redoxin domain-containing protein [Planctomycetes bacterium]|nr:redoxin domain-containing protein [Planctomycetota bacterium]